MASPRMIGRFKTYIPNNRADMRFDKKLYQRNREYAGKHEAAARERSLKKGGTNG